MANQPGYQTPQQSNAAGTQQDQGYYNNQISGSGYFGSPQAPTSIGAPPMQKQPSATGLLGSGFQGEQVAPMGAQFFMGTGGQMGQQVMSGDVPVTGGGGYGIDYDAQAGAPSAPPAPGSNVVGVYNAGGGYYAVVYSDGSMRRGRDYQLNVPMEVLNDPSKQYGKSDFDRMAIQVATQGALPAQNLFAEQLRELQMQDPTIGIQRERDAQLAALQQQRGTALQQQVARERGLGMSGFGGLDLGGLAAQFGQTGAQVNLQAQSAMDAAQQAYEDQLFSLEQQAAGEDERVMSNNANSVQAKIDELYLTAQNASASGEGYVGVNPTLIQALQELKMQVQTRPMDPGDILNIMSNIMSMYTPYVKDYAEYDLIL